MAMNFKIIQLKRKNGIHLTLDGDFDGTSAHELINTLKSCSRNAGKVVIDTSGSISADEIIIEPCTKREIGLSMPGSVPYCMGVVPFV